MSLCSPFDMFLVQRMTLIRARHQTVASDNQIMVQPVVILRVRKARGNHLTKFPTSIAVCLWMSFLEHASDVLLCDPVDARRRLVSRTDGVKLETGHADVDSLAPHGKSATRRVKLRRCTHRLGTWNVQGLNKTGKTLLLERELLRQQIEICGITETHWRGNGHYKSSNFSIFYSGNADKSSEGVAFFVSHKNSESVIAYECINERMMTIKFNSVPVILNVILVYAPTSEAETEIIENFYRDLETTISKLPKKEVCMIMGDFNAKVGNTIDDLHLRSVVGRYGLGERNERGQRLLEFCTDNQFTISNTTSQQHPRRLYTWRSPDGRYKNQIDFILISSRWRSSITSTKTLPSADIGSDHQLLICFFRIKLRVCLRKKVSKLPNLQDTASFNHVLEQQGHGPISGICTINQKWKNLKFSVTEALKIQESTTNLGKKQLWISENTLALCKARREVRQRGLDNMENREKYKSFSRDIQRETRRDKNAYYQKLCKEIEEHSNSNQTKDLFKKIKLITRNFKPRTWTIRNTDGSVVTSLDNVLDVWSCYCEGLYSDDNYDSPELINFEKEPNILMCEIETAIKALAKGKATGIDALSAEIWKAFDDRNRGLILELCQQIWDSGEWPEEWSTSVIFPIHKKGPATDCDNYRLIALISHASKIMLYILRSRLNNFISHQIAPEQAGFVKGRGTREQILNVRILIEKAREYYIPVFMCFVDYEKAFDNVKWAKLWEILITMGVPKHLVNLIKHLYEDSRAVVKIDNALSKPAKINKGVRQGCVLSPLLFNIYTEQLMREVLDDWDGGFTVNGVKLSNLRYADDTLLIAASAEELEVLLERLEARSKDYGLKINYSKSKVMIVDRSNSIRPNSRHIAGCEIVDRFVYLGSLLHSSGDCELEIRRRIQLGRTAMSQLTRVWKDRQITIETKKSLVHAFVFSIFWYASETWVIKAADRRRIDAFEMWCWRRLLRIPWTAHRTNVSVLSEVKPSNRLSSLTSARILNFFGHISRHDNIERLIIQGKPLGRRRRGRSPSRWTDLVTQATGKSFEEATRTACDRQRWKEAVKRVLDRGNWQ